MIELISVTKSFEKNILNQLSFSISKPGIYGILGINGAGKTTTIRAICGLLDIDGGIINRDFDISTELGYMPEELALYKDMSVLSHMKYFCKLLNLNIDHTFEELSPLINKLDLSKEFSKPIAKLSKGTIRKVQFLCAIMHKPKLIILDEPFSGLDPVSTEVLVDEIRKFKDQGRTVLLSTHRIEHAETFCNHIFMLHKGTMIIDAPLLNVLMSENNSTTYELITNEIQQDLSDNRITTTSETLYTYRVEFKDTNSYLEFLSSLKQRKVVGFSQVRPSLRDIFFNKIKNESI